MQLPPAIRKAEKGGALRSFLRSLGSLVSRSTFFKVENGDQDALLAPMSQPGGVLVPPSSIVLPACVTATPENRSVAST
jgi:hypothetical protein